jgi:nicotinamide-nucleotide amidase
MSGFPQEMTPIFLNSLMPKIHERIATRSISRREFFIYGVTESKFQNEFIEHLTTPADFNWGIAAGRGQIKVFMESSDSMSLQSIYNQATSFYTDTLLERPAENILHDFCIANNIHLALAESCTGGLIGKTITDLPGSSRYFTGSLVTYSNEAKVRLLGVPSEVIQEHGAVSETVALAMAHGAVKALEADFALSVTGIAGPDGGTAEKPVGTVWAGISAKNGTNIAHKLFFPLDRERIREFTTGYTLFLLYDFIRKNYPIK